MIPVMKKLFVTVSLFMVFCSLPAFSREIEINSDVITADPDLMFFVVGVGEKDGVELGDGLIVHRSGEKIADAYIIEVRPDVSAAEILNTLEGKDVREGDSILIVKNVDNIEEGAADSGKTAAVPADRGAGGGYAVSPAIVKEGDVIFVEIKGQTKEVFAYARLTLMEEGFSILSSDRSAGILMASKPITLSITRELWADVFAAIDHKIVVSLDIKGSGQFSELKVSSFKEHSQKGKQIKSAVTRDSGYYNELMALASKIKKRSEY